MSKRSVSRSRAISPVISAIIISAVVIAVGGAVWAFSQGAMTITAEDYAEAVINMTDTISERFIIEMVWYGSDSATDEEVGPGDGTKIFELDFYPVVTSSETIRLGEDPQLDDDGSAYTLVDATGLITFLDAPADGVAIKADYKYIVNPLGVWIFNYGTVDIKVKVQVKDITCPEAEDAWKEIPSKGMEYFPIALEIIPKEELTIKAYTKRGNNVYSKYIVP